MSCVAVAPPSPRMWLSRTPNSPTHSTRRPLVGRCRKGNGAGSGSISPCVLAPHTRVLRASAQGWSRSFASSSPQCHSLPSTATTMTRPSTPHAPCNWRPRCVDRSREHRLVSAQVSHRYADGTGRRPRCPTAGTPPTQTTDSTRRPLVPWTGGIPSPPAARRSRRGSCLAGVSRPACWCPSRSRGPWRPDRCAGSCTCRSGGQVHAAHPR